jgi:SMC interacting uncharacterized protein involved in chromosome segregation
MSELPKLTVNAETSAHAVKVAADNWLGYVKSMQTDMQRCEAELEQTRRAADQLIAQLQAQIAKLKAEHANAELDLKQIRKQIERERSELGQEKRRLLKSLDDVLSGAA